MADNLYPVPFGLALPSELACLPNAEHMQRIVLHVHTHPYVYAADWTNVWNEAWQAARVALLNSSRHKAGGVAWGLAYRSSGGLRGGIATEAAWTSAGGALMALAAYDDCAYLLDWPVERIRTHIALSDDPAAILLLPTAIALASTGEQT